MTPALNILSFALLAMTGVAYARRRHLVLTAGAVLYFASLALATGLTWWETSPPLAGLFLAVGVAVPVVLTLVFLVDLIWAPFCLQTTYLTFLCWVLSPPIVLCNFAGLLLRYS